MRLNTWRLIFVLWTAFYVVILVAVTIPDYPRTGRLWDQLTLDRSGYFHEAFYITAGYLAGLAIAYFYRMLWEVALVLESLRKLMGGL